MLLCCAMNVGRLPATSAKPPVAQNGWHSETTYQILIVFADGFASFVVAVKSADFLFVASAFKSVFFFEETAFSITDAFFVVVFLLPDCFFSTRSEVFFTFVDTYNFTTSKSDRLVTVFNREAYDNRHTVIQTSEVHTTHYFFIVSVRSCEFRKSSHNR